MNNCCYLQTLCNKFGDFKIAISSRNEDGSMRWTKHRSVMSCWESGDFDFLNNANHRAILPTEIVFDMDEKPTLKKVQEIIREIKVKESSVAVYFTGSKGYHIHIFWNSFIKYDKKERDAVRIKLYERYNCDIQKIEGSMIATENMPHWKTGKTKQVIDYGIY